MDDTISAYYSEKCLLGTDSADVLHRFGVNGKLSGNIGAASEIRGAVVLLHGPRGCGWHYRRSARVKHMPYYALECTDMGEEDVVFGGEARLAQEIERLIAEKKPELLIVLPSTCSDMIHCEIRSVVERYRDDARCRVIGVESETFSHIDKNVSRKNMEQRVHSFGCGGQAPAFEHKGCGFGEVMCALVEQVMQPQAVVPASVNIESLGWGVGGELALRDMERMLALAGITVNTRLPAATVEQIAAAPRAQLNIARRLRWARKMNCHFGTDYIQVVSPADYLGMDGIAGFYMQIAARLDREAEMRAVLASERAASAEGLARVQARLRGLPVTLYVRAPAAAVHWLGLYTRDYALDVRSIIVDMPPDRQRSAQVSPATFERMIQNLHTRLEQLGCAAEVLVNPAREALEAAVRAAPVTPGGKGLKVAGIRPVPYLHSFYPFDFARQVRLMEDMGERLLSAQESPLLLHRLQYDAVYEPLLCERGMQASRAGWDYMWNGREGQR